MTKKDCILIGFCGRKHSGKSTAANYVHTTTELISRVDSFAAPLKAEAAKIFGPLDRYDKELLRPALTGIDDSIKAIRGQDVWIRDMEFHLHLIPNNCCHLMLIDDVRYPMEADWIKSVGGHVIKITRPGQDLSDKHASETSVDLVQADAEIINEKNLENFLAEVSNTCAMFGVI